MGSQFQVTISAARQTAKSLLLLENYGVQCFSWQGYVTPCP